MYEIIVMLFIVVVKGKNMFLEHLFMKIRKSEMTSKSITVCAEQSITSMTVPKHNDRSNAVLLLWFLTVLAVCVYTLVHLLC